MDVDFVPFSLLEDTEVAVSATEGSEDDAFVDFFFLGEVLRFFGADSDSLSLDEEPLDFLFFGVDGEFFFFVVVELALPLASDDAPLSVVFFFEAVFSSVSSVSPLVSPFMPSGSSESLVILALATAEAALLERRGMMADIVTDFGTKARLQFQVSIVE